MENSEIQKQVMNLGKLLVAELEREDEVRVNTFARWMAHYIAEKIKYAENSQGQEKLNAEKDCFDTILKIWNSRDVMPRRPFFNFEAIFDLLIRLNPDIEKPFYFRDLPNDALAALEEPSESKEWLRKAEEIDKSAKVCIEFCLAQSAKFAKSESTEKWLESSSNLGKDDDRRIIEILIKDDSILNLDDNEDENVDQEFIKQYRSEKIKNRIEHLQKFSDLNKFVLDALKIELKNHKQL